MDGTNLSQADLTNVSLRQAWLRESNLSQAILTGVKFGQELLDFEEVPSCVAVSDDGTWLVIGMQAEFLQIWDRKQANIVPS